MNEKISGQYEKVGAWWLHAMKASLKKHEKAYGKIRAQIASGKLPPGGRLPNERVLAAEHGVAVMTLRKALDRLEDEGLLIRRPYHGTIVTAAKGLEEPLQKRTNLCAGLVVPTALSSTAHPVFSRFLNGLEGALSEHKIRIKMVVSNPAQAAAEGHFLNVIKKERVDGWIIPAVISPLIRSALKRNPAPKVLMHYPDDELSPHFFETDCRALGNKIGCHLLEEGYRRIVVFSQIYHSFIRQQLVAALEETLGQQGGTLRLHPLANEGAADGAQECRNLLRSGEDFDAAVCDDDDVAFGVTQALKENGLTPPDVGVIGAGDFPLGSLITPTLTTIAFPYYQKGREMAGLLVDLLRKRPVEPAHRMFASRLIIRASSQKASRFHLNTREQQQTTIQQP